ncbi:hypothetical protein ACF0H5_018080 [Mactra antiquata]
MSTKEAEPSNGERKLLSVSSTQDCYSDDQERTREKEDLCPFVCGICFEKFDKISPFYAHLRTHGRFENLEMNKKTDMLKALNVRDKLDENIFKCGLCNVYFPSMSLLHDHMVLEENIKDYHYSNVDHTATPNKKVFDVRLARVVMPAKAPGKSVSGSPSKRKVGLTDKTPIEKRRRKNADLEKGDLNEDEAESHIVSKPKSKKKTQLEQVNTSSVETEDNVTTGTRASSRLSRDGSRKRVDYKALAGIVSPRRENEESHKVTETSETSRSNIKHKKVFSARDSGRRTKDMVDEINDDNVGREETDLNDGQSTKERDGTQAMNGKTSADDIKKLNSNTGNVNEEEEAVGNDISDSVTDLPSSHVETQTENLKEDGTHDNEYTIAGFKVFKNENYGDDENDLDYHDSDDDMEDDDDDDDDDFAIPEQQSRDEYLKKHGLKSRQGHRKVGDKKENNCLYPCSVCGKYMTWKALKKHRFAHIKEKSVKCTICNKMYKSKRHLGDHIRSVHTTLKYRCGYCGDILKGKQGFEKHVSMHIIKKEIIGSVEDVEMIEVSDLEYREAKVKQNKKISKRFTAEKLSEPLIKKEVPDLTEDEEVGIDSGPFHGEQLELDRDLVGPTTNLDCKVCSKHFSSHDNLVQHLLEHNDEEMHPCEVCQAYFQTSEHLDNHIAEEHGRSIYKCEICGERFKSFYAQRSHRSKHLLKTDKYYCKETVEKLQEENEKRKQTKHYTPKLKRREHRVPCQVCGLPVRSSRMKRHMEVHLDTKEWECDICHKFYKTRRYLTDHKKKTHFADRSTCDICGQTFKGKTYLETHRQIHGPRDKKCPYCEKAFTTVVYLRAHLMTHQEKKQFRCELCPSAFSHRQRLHIHMTELHSQGDNRPCKYCGELFRSREKARKHERRIHEGIEPAKRVKSNTTNNTSNSVQLLEINVPDEASTVSNKLENKKVVQFISPAATSSAVTTIRLSSGAKSEDNSGSGDGNQNVPHFVQNDLAFGDKQFIKLDNGEEYQVMLEEGSEPLEVIELSEEQHNVFIHETTEPTAVVEAQSNDTSEEQVLEIPENAEQCQILLFPDGSFKLLNVVDNTTGETSQ